MLKKSTKAHTVKIHSKCHQVRDEETGAVFAACTNHQDAHDIKLMLESETDPTNIIGTVWGDYPKHTAEAALRIIFEHNEPALICNRAKPDHIILIVPKDWTQAAANEFVRTAKILKF